MRKDQRALVNPWQPMSVGEYRMLDGRHWLQLHAIDHDGTCTLHVRGTDQNNRPVALKPGEALDARPHHLLPVRVEVGFAAPSGPWGWAAVKVEWLGEDQ